VGQREALAPVDPQQVGVPVVPVRGGVRELVGPETRPFIPNGSSRLPSAHFLPSQPVVQGAIWIAGAQKVVPDLPTALRRVEDHCLPLESARAQAAYGSPSAINRLLILNAELQPGRGTVLLLRQAIGF
jgi:hypothetical protein